MIFSLVSCRNDKVLITKPSIVIIVADYLGYGDLGSFGNKIIKTSNLVRMASESMKMTDCYITFLKKNKEYIK